MEHVTIETLKTKIDNKEDIVVLDVRTPMEWDEGVIEGAKRINLHEGPGFIEKVKELDKSKATYVICRSGGRSMTAAQAMDQLGFSETYNVLGGMSNWPYETVKV